MIHFTLSPELISIVLGKYALRDIDEFPPPASTFDIAEVAFVCAVALVSLSKPIAETKRANRAVIVYKNIVFLPLYLRISLTI